MILTRRDLIKTLPLRWRLHHIKSLGHPNEDHPTYEKLGTLDLDKVTEKEIIQIFGTDAWIKIVCQQCLRSDLEGAVTLEDKFREHRSFYCAECLKEALSSYYDLFEDH